MNLSSDTTSNDTGTCSIDAFGPFIVYITVLISCVSICECLVVIFVTLFNVNLHGNTSILVASLAVNDLLLAIAFVANQIMTVPLGLSHLTKSKLLMCFVFGVGSGATNLSVLHMAVIAVDRYIQIVHPFYYMKEMTQRRTCIILLGLWITDFIFIIIPPTAFYDDKYHRRCIILHQPEVYCFVATSLYFVNLIVVFICYFKIAHVAFKHKQSANTRRLHLNVPPADVELRANLEAAIRSVRFFVLMFGIFFVCTAPPFVTAVVSFIHNVSENIYVGFFSLVPIHSTVNFLIYTYMNKEFYSSMVATLIAMKRCFCADTRHV